MLGRKLQSIDKNHFALPFLLASTDPSVGPVDEVILNNVPEHNSGQLPAWESSGSHDIVSDTIDPRLLLMSIIRPSFTMDLDCNGIGDDDFSGTLDRINLRGSDEELHTRISLLEVDLQQAAVATPYVPDFLSTSSSAAFFTVLNFRECIKAFFQVDILLATIIHRSSFQPEQVDPTLLLAIAISGSAYLHYKKESTTSACFALALRGVAERYIFHRVEQLLESSVLPVDSQSALELCQAAYIIETLQSCVKDIRIRRRIITKCHPMLVDLLRRLEIVGSRHGSLELEQDWHMFVYKESCVRLVHWVFINDAWFTLFSNHPPAMTILEMSSNLPCADRPWNADSSAKFYSLRSQEEFNSSLPCLKSLISGLLADGWTGSSTVDLFKQLDVKHFLVIIFGRLQRINSNGTD